MTDLQTQFWDICNQEANSDFFWLVCHGSKVLRDFKEMTVGRDQFDYVLLSRPRFLERGEYVWHLPHINVDSSVNAPFKEAIRSGIYRVVAAEHHIGLPDQHPAFFIMRYTPGFGRMPSLSDAYNSSLRRKLPSLYNGTTDHINFHRAGVNSDGSRGCFTCERKAFDAFRKPYMTLEQGLMLFINEADSPNVVLQRELVNEFLMKKVI